MLWKKNSYGIWVCPTDNERGYDLVNHPQNKIISTIDRSMFIKDARPENNLERNLSWEAAVFDNWEDIDKNWNTIWWVILQEKKLQILIKIC